jgi:PAS domain S-box-containing protein
MIAIPPALARSVLDDAPDAMIIIDEFGTIWFANRQVSALFGYAREEIIGESIEKLMPERFRDDHIGHRGHFVGNIRVRRMGAGLDLMGQRRDGTEFPLEISLSPVEDVGRTLVAAAIRDVSERKHVEAELLVARDAIEALRELADRANQGRKRFLEAASHDLRQPLQTLVHLNDSLRRLSTDPDAIEALARQEQAVSEISRLLNALFDIGKLESGAIKPELTDFQVATLFEGLRTEFAGIAAEKGLQYEIEDWDGWVHSDPSLVMQILRNLVSNAVQFTREGSVRLSCRYDAARVRIEVLDTGLGIAPEQLPYIFDDFHQVQVPAGTSHEGYGLGLSIARRLATLLGLELDVRSKVAGGSAFSIVLPASRDVAAPLRPERAASPFGSGRRSHHGDDGDKDSI